MNKWWYAFTPAGSIIIESKSVTQSACIKRLLQLAAHMPYGTWENFEKRGYTVEQLELDL